MTDTRTNQPTTEQEPTLEQLMSRLEMARAMDFGAEKIATLKEQIKQAINSIFNPSPVEIAIEAAHVAALAEEAKRNAAKCSAILEEIKAEDRANVGAYSSPRVYVDNPTKDQYTETVTVELAHREALAEDNERDARDWEAFKAQVAVTKTEEIETAHREAFTAEAIRKANDAILAFNGWTPTGERA